MNLSSFIGLFSGCATLAIASAAAAQAPADSAGAATVEEILVTAQKREERLQTVPIAVTAVTGAALESRGSSSIADVASLAPNLIFKSTAAFSGASNASTVFIRGLGQTNFEITTDPGVGTYLDGVYVSRALGGVLDSLDVERVEVLRGPQGTLFGRNTIGGAVSVISKKPGDAFGGQLQATTGSFNRIQVAGALDLPVSDALKLRISGITKNRDGHVRRVFTGERMGNENSDSARLSGSAALAPDFTADFAVDYTRTREESAANQTAFTRPQGPGDIQLAPITIPGLGPVLPGDPRLIPSDPDISYGAGPNRTNLDIWGGNLTLTWQPSFATFKSITAYRDTDGSFGRDGDATPFPTGHQDRVMKFHQFSQEFQITGDLLDGRVKYTGGLYYFDEKATDRVLVTLGQVLPLPGIRISNATHNTAYAAYAQAKVQLVDRLSTTLGIRYTSEDKRYVTSQVIEAFNLQLIARPDARRKFHDVSPRIGLDFQANRNLLVYAYAAKGFKSGGFNSTYVLPVPAPVAYDQERIWTYEAGVKWEGFGRTLRLNAAAFHSDYSDIQVTLFDAGGAPATQNGGRARIAGLELEGEWIPTRWFRLSGNIAFLHARYVKGSILPPPPGIVLLGEPLRDTNRLPNAPDFGLSLSPQIFADVAGGRADARLDITHSSSIQNDASNSPELFQPAYTLLDGSVGWRAEGGGWSLRAGVRNLTDKRIIISGGIGRGPNFGDRNFNRPREWFLTASLQF